MSRPNYPNCPMPVSVIHGVQERQRAYDADPEGYEEAERQEKERFLQEQQAESDYRTGMYESQYESESVIDDSEDESELPF